MAGQGGKKVKIYYSSVHEESPYPALHQLWTSCWLQRGKPRAQWLQQRFGRKVPPQKRVPGQLQASSPVFWLATYLSPVYRVALSTVEIKEIAPGPAQHWGRGPYCYWDHHPRPPLSKQEPRSGTWSPTQSNRTDGERSGSLRPKVSGFFMKRLWRKPG